MGTHFHAPWGTKLWVTKFDLAELAAAEYLPGATHPTGATP